MRRTFLKSKIHRATVTDANLHYDGSISISQDLIEASGLKSYERVDIYNVTNGERFSTYVIPGQPGEICINGAAAWKARVGDKVIIAAYCELDSDEVDAFLPSVVLVDAENKIRLNNRAAEHVHGSHGVRQLTLL